MAKPLTVEQKSQVRRGEAEMRRVSEAWCEVRVQGTESYQVNPPTGADTSMNFFLQQYFTLLRCDSVLHAS